MCKSVWCGQVLRLLSSHNLVGSVLGDYRASREFDSTQRLWQVRQATSKTNTQHFSKYFSFIRELYLFCDSCMELRSCRSLVGSVLAY